MYPISPDILIVPPAEFRLVPVTQTLVYNNRLLDCSNKIIPLYYFVIAPAVTVVFQLIILLHTNYKLSLLHPQFSGDVSSVCGVVVVVVVN
jgi:hypothetical protein